MTNAAREIGVMILAAGASTRFGQPKQLLLFQGKPLIRYAVEAAVSARVGVVVVVLGKRSDDLRAKFADLPAIPVENEHASTGMASSIKVGLATLQSLCPGLTAAILMLGDQPLVPSAHIRNITQQYLDGEHPIVATAYSGTVGVPALFERRFFDELHELSGDTGAKKLLTRHADVVCGVSFPDAAIDIDTLEDYARLLERESQ